MLKYPSFDTIQTTSKERLHLHYKVSETSSIEYLLKDIIKRLKETNYKINFLAFHFAQDLRHLPLGINNNNDEDTEE